MLSSYHAYPHHANKRFAIQVTILGIIMAVLLGGCTLHTAVETPLGPSPPAMAPFLTPTSSPLPTLTPASGPIDAAWTDVSSIVSGICFEAAYDAAERVFVLRDEAALQELYDLADNSKLCNRPVTRERASFEEGAVVVGTWSYGTGCRAQHEVVDFNRDIDQNQITIQARFTTTGDCPYELVRPLWLRIPEAADYSINLQIVE